MWFEFAHGKEKINFMFNNELSLCGVEFSQFIYYDISRLKLRFNSRNIPSSIPKKWNRNEFNALAISLEFTEVLKLEISGENIGFICTPDIHRIDDSIRVTINEGDFKFILQANYMLIDEVIPYIDQRWK